jgi:hypothetical protein
MGAGVSALPDGPLPGTCNSSVFFRNRNRGERRRPDPTDLQFMSEVDAAMRYKGGRWAYVLSSLLFCAFFLILFLIVTTSRN